MIIYKNFEWDVREAAASLTRQGVSFKEASTVFSDAEVVITEDAAPGQLRATGRSARGRVLVVLHRPGPRVRILAAALPGKPLIVGAASEPAPAPVPAPEPEPTSAKAASPLSSVPASAPAAATPLPRSRRIVTPAAPKPAPAPAPVAPAAPEPEAPPESTAASSKPSGAGWTAEAYGIYWDAYSAAREEARRQGKSTREAQRIGKEAGERAMLGASQKPPSAPPASGTAEKPTAKSSGRSGTWRAAARALKVS